MSAPRLTILFVATMAAAMTAQAPPPSVGPQQPTFRSAANYIRVDMFATRDGQAIADLEPEEVDLLEDGVLQKVEAFEHVTVRPAGSQESRAEPNSVAESRHTPADARARVFVVFLDTYHTRIEGSADMRLPLVRFLDRVLGPDDLVAVMTPEMAATDITFGRKATVISNIMDSQWAWGRRGRLSDRDPKDDTYDTCYGAQLPGQPRGIAAEMKERRREKLTLDALEDLVAHLSDLREERKAVLTVTEGWVLFKENRSLASSPEKTGAVKPQDVLLRRPRQQPEDRGNLQGPSRIECETDRLALALLDNTRRLRELTDEANRGNVTFYPVYPQGLAPFDAQIGPDRSPTARQDAANLSLRQDSLRFVADNTDGTSVINPNNIDGALRRIIDDLSSYYLLGYYSTNTTLDGRFRSVTVRVKRPGARVRSRRGYRGRTAEQLLSRGASGDGSSTPTAMSTALNTTAGVGSKTPFRIRSSSWVSEDWGAFWIVGELDYPTLKELAWTAGGKAEVVVLGADGAEIMSRTIEIASVSGGFAIRVPENGAVPLGDYAVRVTLHSGADSALSLSDTARVGVKADGSAIGEAVLWRRGPATGPQYRRTADPRFQRNERIRLELATRVAVPATARLLDRAGKTLQVPVHIGGRPEGGAVDFQWIVAEATLAPLAAGDYAIEVTQGDEKEITGFRIVP